MEEKGSNHNANNAIPGWYKQSAVRNSNGTVQVLNDDYMVHLLIATKSLAFKEDVIYPEIPRFVLMDIDVMDSSLIKIIKSSR